MGGISVWQLVIILVIVLLLFGAKKLRSVGGDLGAAVKGFRGAMKDGEEEITGKPGTDKNTADNKMADRIEENENGRVIDVDVAKKADAKAKDKKPV